jgi:hypothetical protein
MLMLANIDDDEAAPSRDVDLTSLEPRLRAAEGRLAELNDHLMHLRKLESAVARLPRPASRPPNEKAAPARGR